MYGIFTYIWGDLFNGTCIGKYTSPIDGMGNMTDYKTYLILEINRYAFSAPNVEGQSIFKKSRH